MATDTMLAVVKTRPERGVELTRTHLPGGPCYPCRTGKPEVCRHLTLLGVDTAGTFAVDVALPAGEVWKHEPTVPLERAAIQAPLGNASRPIVSAHVPAGEAV